MKNNGVIYQDPEEILRNLAKRIRKAGHNGKGIRLSSLETRLLTVYNMPITAEDLIDDDYFIDFND